MTPKNIAASVRQRLLNKARSDKRPFNELLQYYAMERFLYRLSVSSCKDRFVLKGALMLRVWDTPEVRPTMDIDLLGKTSNEVTRILAQFHEMILQPVEDDGIVFDHESLRSETITEEADYAGLRITFKGFLDSARVNMQIDIGFGDEVYPEPERSDFPVILDSIVPRILCYSRESVIAEKFHAMVKLGMINSRMKDFYDIWLLSRMFTFDKQTLEKAIRLTFEHRELKIPPVIIAFSKAFIDAKQTQWSAFRKRLDQEYLPEKFSSIVRPIQDFLVPVIKNLIE
jgi:hypothetical protein